MKKNIKTKHKLYEIRDKSLFICVDYVCADNEINAIKKWVMKHSPREYLGVIANFAVKKIGPTIEHTWHLEEWLVMYDITVDGQVVTSENITLYFANDP